MTERAIRRLVGLLLKDGMVSKVEHEDFVYVLLGDVESLIVIISILFVSIIIRQVLPTIFFLVCFFSLRQRTGGYHLNSYPKCYIGTLCLYVMVAVIANISFNSIDILLVFAIIAMVVVIYYGSINHPDLDMGNGEIQKSKVFSRVIVVIEISVNFFLKCLGNAKMVVAYSSLAIVLCAILLVLAKLTGQEVKKCEDE